MVTILVMNKINRVLFFLGAFILIGVNVKSQTNLLNLAGDDTIRISYSIAYFGEYGSIAEGVILFKDDGVLKAKYVRYNRNNHISSSFNWVEQKVIEYFTEIQEDYYVIKDTWILDTSQKAFINQLLDEFKNYIPEDGVSTAAEFYLLSTKGNKYTVIDRLGSWDKYKEIHQAFNIEVKVPRRLYFLGIKLKDREVEYIVNK